MENYSMSGFDFFIKREKGIESEFKEFKFLLGKELPIDLKSYFSKYEPIDIFENDIMEPSLIEKIGFMESGVCFVSEKQEVIIEEFYTIQKVLSQINILADQYAQIGVFPIIKSLGRTEIVVSLNDENYGKIYYIDDWGFTDISSDEFCSNNIFDFIERTRIIPLNEEESDLKINW